MAFYGVDIKKENEFLGLTKYEVKKRQQKYGYNEIAKKKKKSSLIIFLSQFNDFIVWVLLVATIISIFLGEIADAITIFIIILMDGILGFIQEYRTEKALEALKEFAAPTAKVIREGKKMVIKAKELVIGDIVELESGDRVPADILILKCDALQSDESILTGESMPIDKKAYNGDKIKQENMVYMGCLVTKGKALGKVIATGMNTEMGKIADMLENINDNKTPLQEKLDKLGEYLVYLILAICALVTITGILRGENIYKMFLVGVSLAVAAIPEGLPAVVTVSLALGVQRMMRKNALVRRLPAVETLGCTQVICSDKTGTLTQNRMTVRKLYILNKEYKIAGEGYDIKGELLYEGIRVNLNNKEAFKKLLECCVLCNNSSIEGNNYLGDPTEIALLVLAAKFGYKKEELKEFKILKENPFDSDRKMMSVLVQKGNRKFLFVKGAPEKVMENCKALLEDMKTRVITENDRKAILSANDKLAKEALRVLAFAYKEIENTEDEKELIFLGLAGMIDPPRKEVYDAVVEAKMAGIVPVMITGDHKLTAEAIAKELGILNEKELILTGEELNKISEKELDDIIMKVKVFARVTPTHKFRIVKAYKRKGLVVAMTGDGVNDAPAVKEADIGVAMGKSGTDVTKESASLILLDDNFATIVTAVKEGRIIYDNIRKFIRYLLSCNIGEVLTMFLSSLLSLPIPLLPIQILFVNLATDGLPAMALSMEKGEKDIMQRMPRKRDESIFSEGLLHKIILRGILIGLCTVASYAISLNYFGNIVISRTIALGTLIMSQLFHVFECRSERQSIFNIGILTNKYLIYAVLSSLFMLIFIIYNPFMQKVFYTQPLNTIQWLIVLLFSGIISLISSLYWYKRN
ncbi:calcium-translocating P-type ATPase, SERCA-type [Caloramator australicus]|uniref:P-type Ca(2+) transporter n=1 Tax=Caloramator australicus RC3 TaxID=857293 RepID=I7KU07_9CLOT|nr:calcium-translocating P-type ATPase, SERCA-type [Caloramator australicus]CCJ33328.1 Cation-transporting ATPase [Caloramator australicus RC3]